MLTIREEQMQLLIAQQRAAFIAELSASLSASYPGMREVCSPKSMLHAVEACVEDAESLGFDARGELARYTMFTLQFGRQFANDSLLPWAANALQGTGSARLPQLNAAAERFSRSVSGAGNRFLLAACERWMLGTAVLSTPAAVSDLLVLYPEKASAVGPEALRQFIASAKSTMDAADIREPLARNGFLISAFLLGWRCHDDPFLEYICTFFRGDTKLRFREQVPRFQAAVIAACRGRIPTVIMSGS